MNANANTQATTTGATANNTQNTQGNNMNSNTQANNTTPAATRHYKKSVIEMYTEAVENTIDTKLTATQVSASGLEYKGLNKGILGEAKKTLNFKSNVWFTKKAMEEAGLFPISDEDYGVILFSSKLKDIDGSNKKEKIITYYRVYNRDSLEVIPV